jgi:hypothetical protein
MTYSRDQFLDILYHMLAVANFNKRAGRHYRCTFESANFVLELLLREVELFPHPDDFKTPEEYRRYLMSR